ncbi:MAG: hypothetical protein PVI40_03540 [Chlamydiota bacterium]|jgi:hypothetical protein
MASQLTPVSHSQQSTAPQAEAATDPADSKTQEVAQRRFERSLHLAPSLITGQAMAQIPNDNELESLDLSRTFSRVHAQPDASSLSEDQPRTKPSTFFAKTSHLKSADLAPSLITGQAMAQIPSGNEKPLSSDELADLLAQIASLNLSSIDDLD